MYFKIANCWLLLFARYLSKLHTLHACVLSVLWWFAVNVVLGEWRCDWCKGVVFDRRNQMKETQSWSRLIVWRSVQLFPIHINGNNCWKPPAAQRRIRKAKYESVSGILEYNPTTEGAREYIWTCSENKTTIADSMDVFKCKPPTTGKLARNFRREYRAYALYASW